MSRQAPKKASKIIGGRVANFADNCKKFQIQVNPPNQVVVQDLQGETKFVMTIDLNKRITDREEWQHCVMDEDQGDFEVELKLAYKNRESIDGRALVSPLAKHIRCDSMNALEFWMSIELSDEDAEKLGIAADK